MPIAVARQGDVTATPGQVPYEGAASGFWEASPVVYSGLYNQLTIGGLPVIYQAKCTFVFSGDTPAGAPMFETSEVTLTATVKKLQNSSDYVLVNGDTAKDDYGNTLTVNCSTELIKSD